MSRYFTTLAHIPSFSKLWRACTVKYRCLLRSSPPIILPHLTENLYRKRLSRKVKIDGNIGIKFILHHNIFIIEQVGSPKIGSINWRELMCHYLDIILLMLLRNSEIRLIEIIKYPRVLCDGTLMFKREQEKILLAVL